MGLKQASKQKLYNTFSDYLKSKYPFNVYKIALDAGFTCPNRDGNKAFGGCTYCSNRSFSPHADTGLNIEEQFERSYNYYKQRDSNSRFIVYLQAYTNTYAPLKELEKLYDKVVSFPDVVGLSIGTRPDCISNATLDLIESYNSSVDVWLEIGCETTHDKTLKLINRQHTYTEFVDGVMRSSRRGMRITTHIIFGLPGESYEEQITTVFRLNSLPINEIKIHHLYISPGTVMESHYQKGEIRLFTLGEWVNMCADIIERLRPDIVIQRLVGELYGEYVLAPRWGAHKSKIIRMIRDELIKRGTHQGIYHSGTVT